MKKTGIENPHWDKKAPRIKMLTNEFFRLVKEAHEATSQSKKDALYRDAVSLLVNIEVDKRESNTSVTVPDEVYWSLYKGFNSFTQRKNSLAEKVGEEASKEFIKVFNDEKKNYKKHVAYPIDSEDQSLERKHMKDEEKYKPVALKKREYFLTLQLLTRNTIISMLNQVNASNLSKTDKAWRREGLENIMKKYENIFDKQMDNPNAEDIEKRIREEYQESKDFLDRILEKAKENPIAERNRITSIEKEQRRIDRELSTRLNKIPEQLKIFLKLKDKDEFVKKAMGLVDREYDEKGQKKPDEEIHHVPPTEEKTRTDKFAFQDDTNSGKQVNDISMTSWRYLRAAGSLLTSLSKIIKSKEYNDLSEVLSTMIEKAKLPYIDESLKKAKKDLEKIIKQTYIDGEQEPDKNFQILNELSSKTPVYFARGVKDYFYYLAGKLIAKNRSKIDPENYQKVMKEIEEKKKNLCTNLFLPSIIRPSAKDISELRNYLLSQRKDVFQNRNVTLLTKLLKNIKEKEFTKEEKQEKNSKRDVGKSIQKTKYYGLIINFLDILKPKGSNILLRRRIENIKNQLYEDSYRINLSEKIAGQLKDLYEKNKDKGITDETEIQKYLSKIQLYCGLLNTETASNRTTKNLKIPKLNAQSDNGFMPFYLQRDITKGALGKNDYSSDFNTFVIKNKSGQTVYVDYITAVRHMYPKSMFEYVDYEPPAVGGDLNKMVDYHFKDKSGETLALYDREYNLLTDADWKRAKYVKLKDA